MGNKLNYFDLAIVFGFFPLRKCATLPQSMCSNFPKKKETKKKNTKILSIWRFKVSGKMMKLERNFMAKINNSVEIGDDSTEH